MSRVSASASLCCFLLAVCTCVCGQDGRPKLRLSANVPSLNVAEGLELDQLLQEPAVANPLYLNFDERRRLWVVQFRQYPWPAGLKLISRNNVWRNVYQPPFASHRLTTSSLRFVAKTRSPFMRTRMEMAFSIGIRLFSMA